MPSGCKALCNNLLDGPCLATADLIVGREAAANHQIPRE
ncbi:hypothetical protein CPT_Paku_005 [Burkholderia phage Paku]|uniref:Uncharacterized protein n=1 Tax=Burkholderia phage Paku TaxID=2859650 RepID=A0AAE7WMP0_9CAUD|nr:hypothetical protein CPT_Paku_005 [Burkholderia phage Paku]